MALKKINKKPSKNQSHCKCSVFPLLGRTRSRVIGRLLPGPPVQTSLLATSDWLFTSKRVWVFFGLVASFGDTMQKCLVIFCLYFAAALKTLEQTLVYYHVIIYQHYDLNLLMLLFKNQAKQLSAAVSLTSLSLLA